MEDVILQRLMSVLEVNTITVNALAKKINVPQPTLNAQLKGERALTSRIIVGILEAFPDVSADWVMRGKGSMYDSDNSKTNIVEAADSPVLAVAPVQAESESMWKNRYDELEKRYDQLLSILGGGMRQKVNVG